MEAPFKHQLAELQTRNGTLCLRCNSMFLPPSPITGLVGIIPAFTLLTPKDNPPDGPLIFTPGQLLLWCTALAFFGVFIAVPLRHQTIVKEKLKFPSGAATASVIATLHAAAGVEEEGRRERSSGSGGAVRRRRRKGGGGGSIATDADAEVMMEVGGMG